MNLEAVYGRDVVVPMNCEACGHDVDDHAGDPAVFGLGLCSECVFVEDGGGPCYPWEFR